MNTSPQQVDIWCNTPSEHQHLEFKEAKRQFDTNRLYRYSVALANEGGGHLILGVTDKAPRSVVGTDVFKNPVKTEKKLFDALGFRVDIEEVNHPDGRVLVFDIPPRPKGTAYHLKDKYLMRSGEMKWVMAEHMTNQSLRERFHLPEQKIAIVS